jgi:drug/metabolite transporter (DMT)-like permease
VMALGSLPALALTPCPAPEVLPWFTGVLLFGPLGMYLGIVALRHAEASMLGPYTLLRLVISVVIAAAVFGERIDLITFVGLLLILVGCGLSASRGAAAKPVVAVPARIL